jgi:phosphoglycolate phosphatase-like HAD superfamily hydrolase
VSAPAVLALDFDGVVCDGMREYFQSSWRAYRRLRASAPEQPPPGVFERFARLRPLVESGWEMPLLVHAAVSGADEAALLADWRPEAWLADLGHPREAIAAALDRVRDEWIAGNEADWLDHHRFYPGVIDRLRGLAGSATRVAIVTTKEGRFARTLLARAGVELPAADVLGKEVRRPKRETLRALIARESIGPGALWFVEDRLETLRAVAGTPELDGAGLFLAAWGYNTPGERDAALRDERIALLALERFGGDFAAWTATDGLIGGAARRGGAR